MATQHLTCNHPRFKDLSGIRFKHLVVIRISEINHKRGVIWECLCDCGRIVFYYSTTLRRGQATSCGCMRGIKHGEFGTRLHICWLHMIGRCTRTTDRRYPLYGGRGIRVCERWMVYVNFRDDMGHPPPGMSIERIDNEGNYEPGNCRWATQAQQMRNTRCNRVITFFGKTMCMTDWAIYLNLSNSGLSNRFKRGWSVEKALATPTMKKTQ